MIGRGSGCPSPPASTQSPPYGGLFCGCLLSDKAWFDPVDSTSEGHRLVRSARPSQTGPEAPSSLESFDWGQSTGIPYPPATRLGAIGLACRPQRARSRWGQPGSTAGWFEPIARSPASAQDLLRLRAQWTVGSPLATQA